MDGNIQIYYGLGRGKTTAALGLGIRAAGIGQQVIMVQFLKKKHSETLDYLKRLEPELQIFRFETASCGYFELSEEKKQEQQSNIKSALSYTRKVIDTAQSDLLILDDILGLVEHGIITEDELLELLSLRDESMTIILTGRTICPKVAKLAECIYRIEVEKENSGEILKDIQE